MLFALIVTTAVVYTAADLSNLNLFLSYERFYKQDYESFADGQGLAHDRFVAKHRKDQLPHYGRQLFVVAYIAQ